MKKSKGNLSKILVLSVSIVTALTLIFPGDNFNTDSIASATIDDTNSTINRANSEISNNVTLGDPIYVEYYKINRSDTMSQENTTAHENQPVVESFLGNGTLLGLDVVVASGNATFTLRGNDTVLIEGNAEMTLKEQNNNTDRAPYQFRAIGNYEPDGSFKNTGTAFFEANATGKLSFLSNMVGIYKDQTNKDGNGIFLMWKWE